MASIYRNQYGDSVYDSGGVTINAKTGQAYTPPSQAKPAVTPAVQPTAYTPPTQQPNYSQTARAGYGGSIVPGGQPQQNQAPPIPQNLYDSVRQGISSGQYTPQQAQGMLSDFVSRGTYSGSVDTNKLFAPLSYSRDGQTLSLNPDGSIKNIGASTQTSQVGASGTKTTTSNGYTGTSIVDYLSSAGQASDFNSRAALAAKNGITNYTGTAQQNTALLGTLRAQAAGASSSQGSQIGSSMASGNVGPTGVPNGMAGIMGAGKAPTMGSTIPVSGLSTDYSKTLQDITNSGLGGVGSDAASTAAGVSSLFDQLVAPELKNYQESATTLKGLETQLGGQSQDFQNALAQMGLPAAYQQIQSLNVQAAQLKGKIDAFDAETAQGTENLQNQPIPVGLISGQQATFQKQRDLTKLAMTAQLTATIGLSEAYKGNIDTGLALIKQSIDMKYAPVLAQIDLAKSQIQMAGQLLTRADSKAATVINTLLDSHQAEQKSAQDQELKLQSLGAQAAAAGAPLSLVQSALATGDIITASSMLNQYVHATGETTAGGASGTFTKNQLNNGAENAGLDLPAFGNLPYEVQNFYVNAPAATIKAIQDNMSELQNTGDVEGFNATIDNSSLSAGVKSYLKQQAQQYAGKGTSSGGGNFFSNAVGAISSVASNAWGAITNWLGGQFSNAGVGQ